jgi:putative Mg2+ transporter-C (MgtC) family protein
MFASLDWSAFSDDLTRLAVAAMFGGILGIERELSGHWAGMRTHMMVALGSALFVLAGQALVPSDLAADTRVIQGIASGIGFLGAGTILKLSDKQEIKGLTTASSIWLTAALGVTAGLAQYELALASFVVSIVVLSILRPIESVLLKHHKQRKHDDPIGGSGLPP